MYWIALMVLETYTVSLIPIQETVVEMTLKRFQDTALDIYSYQRVHQMKSISPSPAYYQCRK